MIDIQNIKAKAKWFFARVTSVGSGLLSAISPQWTKFVIAWKGWTPDRKQIAVGILIIGGIITWSLGVNVTRYVSGGYHSARSYFGSDDLSGEIKKLSATVATKASEEDVTEIKAVIDGLNKRVSTLEQKKDPAPSPVSTGTVRKKKPVPSNASSWFSIP